MRRVVKASRGVGLSGNGMMSCASCHRQERAFTNGRASGCTIQESGHSAACRKCGLDAH